MTAIADVVAAGHRLAGHAHRTPVMRSTAIDELVGARVYFKCETFQKVGAFKFRGAYNALSQIAGDHIVAFSSGNHAQAVALAARMLGKHATIVMPTDAPPSKLAATRGYGAEVVLYDRFRDDREAIAKTIARERAAPIVPPYDHPDIIAGQGTAALELFDEVGELDVLVTPLGGGGLLSGSAIAARARAPHCRVYGVEPAAGNDGQRSLAAGEIVHIATPDTIADGAQTQHLGQLTFPIIQRDVAAIVTATDDELVDAMILFAERMKLVVEPTGCLGLAGLRHVPIAGARVGVIVSGGNVDPARYAALIAARSGTRPSEPSR
jgi:threonine dehydratase